MVTSLPVDHQGSYVHVCGMPVLDSTMNPVLFVHDMHQQSDELHHVLSMFFERGCSSYMYDLRGHGRSGNLLGHINRFEDHVTDLLQVMSWVKHAELRRTPILVGYGLGALVVTEFVRKFGSMAESVVLIGPLNEIKNPPHILYKIFLKVMADFWPTFRLQNPLFPNMIPIRYDHAYTAKYLHEIFLAIERFEGKFIEYSGDILLVCPEQDQLSSYHQLRKSVAFYRDQNLLHMDLRSDHFVFDAKSPHLPQIMEVILDWVRKHSVKDKILSELPGISRKKDVKLSIAVDSA